MKNADGLRTRGSAAKRLTVNPGGALICFTATSGGVIGDGAGCEAAAGGASSSAARALAAERESRSRTARAARGGRWRMDMVNGGEVVTRRGGRGAQETRAGRAGPSGLIIRWRVQPRPC